MRIMILVAACLAFLTGCESNVDTKVGALAPAIAGVDINAEPVNLHRLKGKVVVVYFWTDSCCGENVKQLEPLYQRYSHDQFAMVAIAELCSQKDVAAYARKNGITFTMLADEGANLLKQYRVLGFPTVFILDRNGIIREKILGAIQADTLRKLVDRQFGKKSGDAGPAEVNRR
ncbi:TlpA family protein disulfide reductase [Geomonas oryzisoli]|uniref:TlpA family protein disulfide reductase n=1 Tax=Geomonas oryzisoli TaxID=2847992 RepID=A0ABX8J684_9BACT|nr:TlpA disulfide reductase family protein [Geomonas oryzisoli]QWV93949.1 TlpA family protein disulfide reductase [Geomonas oryzisoli]